MEFAIDTRTGINLMLAAAIVTGAILGFRARALRAEESLITKVMLRSWDRIFAPCLGYVWLVGLLAAYPSYAAAHASACFAFPLMMLIMTFIAMWLSLGLFSRIFSKFKRAADAYQRRKALY